MTPTNLDNRPFKIGNYRGRYRLYHKIPLWLEQQRDFNTLFEGSLREYKNNRKTRVALIEAPFIDKMENNGGSAQLATPHCFVKAFHSPQLWHRLGRTLGYSRAKATFDYSQLLLARGICVPKPYAYLDGGLSEKSSYFFSEAINNSPSINDYLACQAEKTGSELVDIFFLIGKQLAMLHALNLQHGDFKWGNILIDINHNQVIIIDLDAVKPAARKAKARDIARFLVNGEESTITELANPTFIKGYTSLNAQGDQAPLKEAAYIKSKIVQKHRKKYPQRYSK